MSDKYFVIYNSDGDTRVKEYNKEQLLKAMNEDGYYTEVLDFVPEQDTNYWNDKCLIIKGNTVVPSPVKIVQSYDVV